MPAFSNLPNEVVSDIVSYLPAAELGRMACVSRRLQDISLPLLYITPYLPKSRLCPVRLPSRELFLRTLLTPSGAALAADVRSLHLEWDDAESERPDYCISESLAVRSAIASRRGLDYPLRTQGAQLMIILDLLPQLRVLHLISAERPPSFDSSSFECFLERSTTLDTLPLGLQSLVTFHCTRRTGPGINGFSGRTMLTLLKLPNIRTLDVPNFTTHEITLLLLHGEPPRSTVTKLRFSASRMPCWELSFILRAPIALTHLSYTTDYFNLVGIMKALVPLRTTLRSLHLGLSDAGMAGFEKEHRDVPGDAGSLREWTVLTTLRCGLTTLLGAGPRDGQLRLVDVLPVSIRDLQILHDRFWSKAECGGQVEELLRWKWEQVPVLERVDVMAVVRRESWWDAGAKVVENY